MAITIDAVTQVNAPGANPSTSHTCSGSGRYLAVLTSGVAAYSAFSYNGAALTLLGQSGSSGAGDLVQIFGLANPASGTNTLTSTGSADGGFHVVSLNGVRQTASAGAVASATGSSTGPTVSVSSAVGDLVIGAIAADAGTGTPGVGAGQTQLAARGGSVGETAYGSYEDGAASSTTHSYSLPTTGAWAIAAVALHEASNRLAEGTPVWGFPHPPMRAA